MTLWWVYYDREYWIVKADTRKQADIRFRKAFGIPKYKYISIGPLEFGTDGESYEDKEAGQYLAYITEDR